MRQRGKVRTLRHGAAVALCAVAALALIGWAPVGPATERVSVDSGSGGGRELPAITSDASRVVFVGRGSTNQGVWLRDRAAGTTYRLTSGSHFNPAISDDGNWVAYVEYGTNRSVYVIDISDPSTPGAPELVSRAQGGNPADGLSDYPAISADGRYVAFQSTASNLTPGTPLPSSGGPNKVYVKDRTTGAVDMVSVDGDGTAQPGNGIKPDITPDGRYVAFASEAVLSSPPAVATAGPPPGHGGDEEGDVTYQQIYVRDLVDRTTEVVSVSSDGALGNGTSAFEAGPSISDDAQRVTFESQASNLVPGDTNAMTDAFAHDRATGTTVRLSERPAFEELGAFHPVSPTRLLDTRQSAAVGPGETLQLQVEGVAGVPAEAVAVALNVTIAEPTAVTFVTVFPADEALPLASNLNTVPDRTIANAVTAKLSATGAVSLYNAAGSAQLIVDLAGWYDGASVAAGGGFHAAPPQRLIDTRTTTPVGPGGTLVLPVVGGDVPDTATAVALNVTLTDATASSYVTAHASDQPMPMTSNVNVVPGQTVANSVVVEVGADGAVHLDNAAGTLHMVVDLAGWYDGTVPGGGVTAVTPTRLADTRIPPASAVTDAAGLTLPVLGVGGVPATGVTAVILNVTAVEPTNETFLTVFPTGTEQPATSNVNLLAGQIVANQVMVPVGADGSVSIANAVGSTHVVVDLAAWVSGTQVAEGGSAPVISGDGAIAAFQSLAGTLTDDDSNGVMDVFTNELATGGLQRASVVDETAGGTEASGTRVDGHTGETVAQVNGTDPAIDGTGRGVAFVSNGDLANDRPVEAEEGEEPAISTEPASYVRTRS